MRKCIAHHDGFWQHVVSLDQLLQRLAVQGTGAGADIAVQRLSLAVGSLEDPVDPDG